jgi:hypothetical protein
MGSVSQDFAYLFIPAPNAVAVANGAPILFTNIVDQPANSKISLAAGIVTVNDTGFYQVTWGVCLNANTANQKYALRENGVASTTKVANTTTAGGGDVLVSCTAITQVTTKPFTFAILNQTGAAVTPTTSNNLAPGVGAYMTIIKLQ